MGLSLSDLNPFKPAKKILKKVAKPFRKASKFLPKELRWAAPYLAAVAPYTSFMMPGGIANSAIGRGLMSSLYNVAGQAIADPEGEDINLLSTLLAGGQGALTTPQMGDTLRDMRSPGVIAREEYNKFGGPGLRPTAQTALENRSLLTKASDLGLTGLGKVADLAGGAGTTLSDLASGEVDLFKLANAKKGLQALTPALSQGTGDVFKAEGDKAIREYEAADAAEQAEMEATTTADEGERASLQMQFMREAGHDEETIKETLEMNDLGDYYEAPEGAAQGGIIGLKHGGMLNLGGNEMDYRGGGFVPIGKRERADDVPARLSKNEFVMTADAVKAAGGGSVNKGAQRMYNVMNQLEARA
jgi:hypothetical protein